MRRRWTCSVGAAAVVVASATAAVAAPAELDPTFGDDGVATVALHEADGITFSVGDVAVTDAGSTMLLGVTFDPAADGGLSGFEVDLAVARLDPDGRLDTSYGDGGVARIDAGGLEIPGSLAVDGQGRTVFSANRIPEDSTVEPVVGRVTASGEVDEDFAGDGIADLSSAPAQFAGEVVIDAADRPAVALVGGTDADQLQAADALVTRLTAAGDPDPAFSGDGTATVAAGRAGAFALAHDGAGGYVVTGTSEDRPFVARLGPTGTLVDGFGDGGILRLPVAGGIGFTIQRSPDGDFTIGGPVGQRTGMLARVDADGEVDPSFGRDGIRTVRAPDGDAMSVADLAFGPSGTVTFVGSPDGGSPQPAVGRVLASGRADSAFGADGYVHPIEPGPGTQVSASAVAPGVGGHVVAAGFVGGSDDGDAFAARFRPVAPGAPVDGTEVERVAGDDRVATAIELSQQTFASTSEGPGRRAGGVVLAAADRFPDALVAAPYAAANDAPLLLNPTDRLDAGVADEIRRVLDPEVGTVTLMGGTAALSAEVESELQAAGYLVSRVAGADRYETSVRAAESLAPSSVLLARGDAAPDALAAGPAAAQIGGAVLLTAGQDLPAAVEAYLDREPDLVRYAVGGLAASALPSAEPIVGADRYGTAALVAERFFHTPARTVVASGERFPDALAGGTLAALTGAPLLLTTAVELPAATDAALRAVRPYHRAVTVAGGTAVVADAVVEAVRRAVG